MRAAIFQYYKTHLFTSVLILEDNILYTSGRIVYGKR